MKKAVLLILGAVIALGLTTGVGVAAAQACPNEAFRIGPAALLPGCRAYEMVSPVEKGGDILSNLSPTVAASGEAVEFYSNSSFADSQGAPLYGAYVARRETSEWRTESVDAAQEAGASSLSLPSPASSPDLSETVQLSLLALTPGAIEGGTNIYLSDNAAGTRRLIVALPRPTLFERVTKAASPALVVGGSQSWNHILLSSRYALTPEAPERANNLYDYTEGSLHLINYVPDESGGEELAGGATAVTTRQSGALPYAHPVSGDGSRIFFSVNGSIYMREDDTRTVPISISQIPGEEGVIKAGEQPVANAAGTVVDFLSGEALVPGTECGTGRSCLYSYDLESGRLRALTPTGEPGGTGVQGLLAAGGEGSIVYFASAEGLDGAPAAESGVTTNLYAAGEGGIRFIGQTKEGNFEETGPSRSVSEASPNGLYFAFSSYSPMTSEAVSSPLCQSSSEEPHAEGDCRNVYLYDYTTRALRCVSCGTEPGEGNSSLGGQEEQRASNFDDEYPRAVLDDGTVYFDTPNRLAGQDVNSVDDVYSWREGAVSLLSGGTTQVPAIFGDAAPDGRNVFFTTAAPLVGQDIDQSVDLYDARVEGGLAGQLPSGATSSCKGEACRPPSPSTPAALGFGSGAATPEPCAGPTAGAATANRRAVQLGSQAAKVGRRSGAKAKKRAQGLRRRAKVERKRAAGLRKRVESCQEVGR